MTIQQPYRKTSNKFLCIVKRAAVFNVFFQPQRWEGWIVLADSHSQAMEAAKYNFYRSNDNDILVSKKPINNPSYK